MLLLILIGSLGWAKAMPRTIGPEYQQNARDQHLRDLPIGNVQLLSNSNVNLTR